jgi:DNA helicase MCM8
MNDALLSRFDLVFILLDKPDEQMDRFLSDHIMKIRSKGKIEPAIDEFSFKANSKNTGFKTGMVGLYQRLKTGQEETDPIPTSLLRKYISYARQYSHPQYTINLQE